MTESNLIFLVDDDPDYKYLVQQVFKLFLPNHQVRFFDDGADLIQTVQSSLPAETDKPIAILMDIDMPQMDGFETLARLKEIPIWNQVNVIIMTNRDHEDYQQESYRLGAYLFLLKPVSLPEIQTIMTRICEMQGEFASLASPAS